MAPMMITNHSVNYGPTTIPLNPPQQHHSNVSKDYYIPQDISLFFMHKKVTYKRNFMTHDSGEGTKKN